MTRTETNAVIRSPYGIGTLLCTRRMAAALAVGMMLLAAAPASAAVSITANPSNVTACEGNTASFSVVAVTVPSGGTLAYQWRRGTTNLSDGGTISGVNTATLNISMVVPGDAGTNYNVVVTDMTNGGSATSTNASLTVNLRPATPDGSASPNPICAGGSTTLDATAVTDVVVDWYEDSCGVTPIGTGATSMSPGATKTYYGRARNTVTGCISLVCDEVTVTVVPAPTADAGGPYSTCGETAVEVTGTADDYSSLLWESTGTGTFDDENALVTNYNPSAADVLAGSVTLTLTAVGNTPCPSVTSDPVTLSITTPATADAGGPYSTCGETAVEVTGTADDYSSLLWESTGTGTFDDENALVTNYNPSAADVLAGSVTLTLTAVGNTPCPSVTSDPVTLSITTPATADAGGPYSMCGETAVEVTGTADDYSSLLWESTGTGTFDDENALVTNYNPSAADVLAGSVTLTLTAVGNTPCPSVTSDPVTLSITTPATADAGGPYSTCGETAVEVTGTADDYSSLLWESTGTGTFDDENALVTNYNPSAADVLAGSVTLTLTAVGNTPCPSVTSDPVTLSITTPATADAGGPYSTCGETAVEVTGTADDYSSLLWESTGTGTFDDENALVTNYNPSAADVLAGSVTLTLTAVGNTPCPSVTSDPVTLSITTPATADAGGPYSMCGETAVEVTGTADDYSSLLWESTGTGTFDDENALVTNYNPSAADVLAGSVTLTLTAVGNTPCPSVTSDPVTLSITTPPSGSASGPYDTCDLSPVPVSGTASNFSSVQWSVTPNNGGTFTNGTSLNATYNPVAADVGNTLTLTLTISGNGPCSAPAFAAAPTTSLVVSATPTCGITAVPTQVSANSTGNTATTTLVSGATYAWTISGSPGAMITAGQGTNSITYNAGNGAGVTLGVTVTLDAVPLDPGACVCISSLPVNINTGPGTLTLAFEPGSDLCYKCGDELTATLRMSALATPAAGFQAFLGYDSSILQFDDYTYTSDPFCLHMIDSPSTVHPPLGGQLNFAGGIAHTGTPPDDTDCPTAQSPTLAPALLVTMTFTVIADDALGDCTPSDLLYFRDDVGPAPIPPSHLVDAFANPFAGLVTVPPQEITVDCDNPVVIAGTMPTFCYINYVNLAAAQAAAEADALAVTNSSDVCGLISEIAVTSGPPCDATITVTATDCAGNSDFVTYTNIHLDPIAPTISCPPAVTVSCPSQVPPADFAFGSFTPGSCSSAPEWVSDSPASPPMTACQNYVITRTYRIPDPCYNVSCTQTITVSDVTPPSITCPSDVTVSCASMVPAADFAGGVATDNCGGTPGVAPLPDVITPGSCVNRFSIARTYRATDACGNTADCTQTITVNDVTPPSITCPSDVTVSCASMVPAADFAGGVATDNCGGTPGVAPLPDVITPGSCVNRFSIARTYRATDACGNTADCTQTITVNDVTPPSITCPSDVTVSCASMVPAADFAGGVATDNCGGTPGVAPLPDVITPGSCVNRFSIARTYRATDACGNTADCTQTITVNDVTPPSITCPSDVTVSCASMVPAADFAGGVATDNCGGTPGVAPLPDVITPGSCVNRFSIARTYRATDACGNTADCTQTITVNDVTPPTITCPSDVTVNADAGGCTASSATVNLTPPTGSDNCGAVTVSGQRNDNGAVSGDPEFSDPYPLGSTTVTWIATDACNQTASCNQLVTVSASNVIKVTLDLGPIVDTGGTYPQTINRCITFQVWNCPGGVPLATVNQVVTFEKAAADPPFPAPPTPTRAVDVEVLVPCGTYSCITARDRHHTLRRTLGALDGFVDAGATYTANFVAANKPLTGGNLNDDNVIDILDFGVYTGQYLKNYDSVTGAPCTGAPATCTSGARGGNTTCTTPFPHADISGNGFVFGEDFTFIQDNFLAFRDPNCCNAANVMSPGDGPEEPLNPLVRISVRELQARNLHDLIPADLNHDGMLDVADMNAWAQGVRPTPVAAPVPAPIPEPVRGTKASSSALRGG